MLPARNIIFVCPSLGLITKCETHQRCGIVRRAFFTMCAAQCSARRAAGGNERARKFCRRSCSVPAQIKKPAHAINVSAAKRKKGPRNLRADRRERWCTIISARGARGTARDSSSVRARGKRCACAKMGTGKRARENGKENERRTRSSSFDGKFSEKIDRKKVGIPMSEKKRKNKKEANAKAGLELIQSRPAAFGTLVNNSGSGLAGDAWQEEGSRDS